MEMFLENKSSRENKDFWLEDDSSCDEVPENILHSLWECKIAELWLAVGFNEKIKPTSNYSCKDWFAELLERLLIYFNGF